MILSVYFLFFITTSHNDVVQAQPIDPDLTAKLLGRGVATSPIVTVEPRRRKFHKAITLSMPAPKAHSQGMINQYSGSAPTLRLLCSITGMLRDILPQLENKCFIFSVFGAHIFEVGTFIFPSSCCVSLGRKDHRNVILPRTPSFIYVVVLLCRQILIFVLSATDFAISKIINRNKDFFLFSYKKSLEIFKLGIEKIIFCNKTFDPFFILENIDASVILLNLIMSYRRFSNWNLV